MSAIITISAFQYELAGALSSSDVVELRVFYTGGPGENFLDADNNVVPYGSATNLYLPVDCTVSGGEINIDSFALSATDNSSNIGSVVTAQFFINGAPSTFLFTDWIITNTLGAAISYASLYTYNLAAQLAYTLDSLYLTAPQVTALILSAVGALNKANASPAYGVTALSIAPTSASNPLAYGTNDTHLPTVTTPVYYASQFASVNAAITSIGSAVATLIISAAQTTITTVSIPTTLTLVFIGAGSITITTGNTVTIAGPLDALPRKIFFNALAGQGTIAFSGNIHLAAVSPEWWGAAGDGVTNDAAPFTAAITAFKTISLQKVSYALNTAITAFGSSVNGRIIGNGGTIVTTLNDTVFSLALVTNFKAYDLNAIGNYAGTANNQTIFSSNPGGSGIEISQCVFTNLAQGITFADGASNIDIHDNRFTRVNASIQGQGGAIKSGISVRNNFITGDVSISTDDAIAISGASQDVVITGNIIDQKGTAGGAAFRGKGILLESSSTGVRSQRAVIANNIIRNSIGIHVLQSGTSGIMVLGSSTTEDWKDVTITDNVIENAYRGILLSTGASGMVVKGNIVRITLDVGIYVVSVGLDDSDISHNRVSGAANYGIYLANALRPRIIGNYVETSSSGIVVDTSNSPMLVGNTAKSSTNDGILISATLNAIIDDNHLISNGRYGLNLTNTSTGPRLGINHYLSNVTAPVNGYAAQIPSLTIASGVLVLAGYSDSIIVETEGAAATDDLDTISGGAAGDVITFQSANSGHDTTFKNGTGNIICGSDFTLATTKDRIVLKFDGTNWYEIARSIN